MKVQEGVINILNKVLTVKLMAINQHLVHATMCEYWGYERLYHQVRERSIDEMKEADRLIGHILYLEEVPKVCPLSTVHLGATVREQLQLDLTVEQNLLTLLGEGGPHWTEVADSYD